MKISGHWFCEHCDDVITLPAPADGKLPPAEKCPVCHYRTAIWIPHVERPVSDETARDWFVQMHEIVNAALPLSK